MHITSNLIIVSNVRMHKLTWSASQVEAIFLVTPNKPSIRHHVTKLDGLNL